MPVQNQISLPVWGKTPITLRPVQGEALSRTVTITLIDKGGQPVDLTGGAVRLYVQKPDNTVVFMDGTITDAAGGVCSFTLTLGITAAAGIASCQVLVSWSDNQSLKAVGLLLDIQPSSLEDAVESTSDFSALVVALNKADTAEAIATQAAKDAQQAVTDANAAIVSTSAVTAVANSAAIAANAGAAAANQAATNAGHLYQMINPLTGQLSYVTDIIDGLTAYIFRDAITAQQMDGLNKTAQDFDALAISAADFDARAKAILGVA